MDKLNTLGSVLAKSFQLRGLFGVDLVLSDNDLYVFEVNPRYTASVEVLERATSIHALGGWSQVPAHLEEACHAKAILFAKRDVVVSPQFSAWALQHADDDADNRLADVPAPEMNISQGRPVITVFAQGDAPETAGTSLQEWLAEVEARLG